MIKTSIKSVQPLLLLTTLLLSSALLLSQDLRAQNFSSTFSASEIEKNHHRRNIQRLARVAYDCMEADHQKHVSFYRTHGISPFYGDRSHFGRLSWSEKQNYLRRIGKNPSLLSQMEATSCVGFAMKCMGQGFRAIGQEDVWLRIRRYAAANSFDGASVIDALRELGWYVMFWNPDVSRNAEWDAAEKRRNANNTDRFWGYHSYRWATVRNSMRYWKNTIDDRHTLVNFGTRVPRVLHNAPIFFGIAHTGYHVFPGARGHVIEAHSTRPLTDFDTIERADFNPLVNGGAPRGTFRSGLIAVPPGYEP